MAITLNGIVAKERWDSYEKGRSDRGPFVRKEYLVPYASADAFTDAVMGGATATDATNGDISYTGRQPCPENPTLFAIEAGYKGLAEADHTGGSTPQFQFAVVTVSYGVLSWEQAATPEGVSHSFPNEGSPGQPFTYAIQEIDFAGEFITIPEGKITFSDGTLVKAPIGKHVGSATLRFTRKFVPYLPIANILRLMNKLNNQTMFGAERGKIRFADAKTHREAVSDGTKVQEIELIFAWREHDWNEFLNPADMVWDSVHLNGDSSKTPYEYDDLRVLLR